MDINQILEILHDVCYVIFVLLPLKLYVSISMFDWALLTVRFRRLSLLTLIINFIFILAQIWTK